MAFEGLSEKLQKLIGNLRGRTRITEADVKDITNQLSEAQKILDTYRNTDGTINTGIKGADEALTVASTLQSMLDRLTRPAYMSIQANQVEDALRKPLNSLQDFKTYCLNIGDGLAITVRR